MQNIFGKISKENDISDYLHRNRSILSGDFTFTRHNKVGYGIELKPHVSFKNEIIINSSLSILAIGDIIGKADFLNCLDYLKKTTNENVDFFILYRDELLELHKSVEGVYCLILIDYHSYRVCIISDKCGFIPIYYYYDKNKFIFSTSLKGILADKNIHRKVNCNALYEYFKMGFSIPPQTLIQDIHVLLPGNIIDYKENCIKFSHYNQPIAKNNISDNLSEIANEYYEALEKSLMNKVSQFDSIALLLSGGVDSAAIAAILNRHKVDFKCYTLDFNKNNPVEINGAKKVTNLFKQSHVIFDTLTPDMVKYIPKVIWLSESPILNAVPEYLLCNEIDNDIKIVLSGDGNDLEWGILSSNYLSTFDMSKQNFSQFYLNFRGQLTDDLLDGLFSFKTNPSILHEKFHYLYNDTGNIQLDMSCIDSTLFGHNYAFHSFGKIKMNPNSQLFRFPYIDNEISKIIKALPEKHKQKEVPNKDFISKYLFKFALETKKLLPSEIIHTKKTWMYSPNAEWLRGDLCEYFKTIVFNKDSCLGNYFKMDWISQIWNLHLTTKRDFSYILMLVFSFEIWHKIFIEDLDMKYFEVNELLKK